MKSLVLVAFLIMTSSVFASTRSRDLLNDARATIRHELRDARSGNYESYRSTTMRSILETLQSTIRQASDSTDSEVSRDFIRVANKQIEAELRDSFNFSSYRLITVINVLEQVELSLTMALKYDDRGRH